MFCSNAMLYCIMHLTLELGNSLMNRLQGWCHSRMWGEVVSLWIFARCKSAICKSASQSLQVWKSLAGVLTSTSSCFILMTFVTYIFCNMSQFKWTVFHPSAFVAQIEGSLASANRWKTVAVPRCFVLTMAEHTTWLHCSYYYGRIDTYNTQNRGK